MIQLDADGKEAVAANSLRKGNEMHLDLQQLGANGLIMMAQIRFFDIEENSFSWENNTSIDNGKSWFISGSHRMRRRVSDA